MTKTIKSFTSGGAAFLFGWAALGPSAALPQEFPAGGYVVGADLSFGVKTDDNPDLVAGGSDSLTTAFAILGVSFSSETQTQSLSFNLAGEVDFNEGNSDYKPREVYGPDVQFRYNRQGANSLFGVFLSRTESDVRDFFYPDAAFGQVLTTQDLIVDDGTVVRLNYGLNLQTGIDGPIGFDLSISGYDRSYQDTTSPDLYDENGQAIDIALRGQLSRTVQGRIIAGYETSHQSDDANTDQETTRFGFGALIAFDDARSLDLYLQQVNIDTTETIDGDRGTTSENGLSFGATFTDEGPVASYTYSASRDIQTSGAISTLSFGRSQELEAGLFAFTVGASKPDGEYAVAIGSLQYRREQEDSVISATLARDVTDDSDFNPTVFTTFGVSYDQSINSLSSFGLSAQMGFSNGIGLADSRQSSALFTASYSYDLTQDWALTTGYQGQYSKDQGADAAWSNTLFLTVDRSFRSRP